MALFGYPSNELNGESIAVLYPSQGEFRRIGHEDYVFWLEAIRRSGSARRVPDDGRARCFYAVSASSLSGNKSRAARWQWQIYRNELRLGLLLSAALFVRYVIAALRKRV